MSITACGRVRHLVNVGKVRRWLTQAVWPLTF